MKNYFKKFSIMFAIALAIIGLGMIYGGSGANAATVGQQLTEPESGWKRYENTDSNISYIGKGWDLYYYSTESGGNTSYTFNINDTSVKFNFTGNKIRIINPINTHNNSIDLYIDGIKVNNHSLLGSNRRQIIVYENTGLSNSEHSLEYKFVGTGEAVFDAIDIDENGKLLPYNESITLDKSTMNLTQGDSGQLKATTTPE
ncbi:MAG: bacterial surface protein containing Ig-like domain [Clostridiaceae bacterium]|nr:bacterial surface protein containing Ig-like domain [Clostridiaceae bacterium]